MKIPDPTPEQAYEAARIAAITFPICGFIVWFLYNVWPGGK